MFFFKDHISVCVFTYVLSLSVELSTEIHTMGILLLIGTILFAYGPAFSAVVILAKKRPYLFLVSLIAYLILHCPFLDLF